MAYAHIVEFDSGDDRSTLNYDAGMEQIHAKGHPEGLIHHSAGFDENGAVRQRDPRADPRRWPRRHNPHGPAQPRVRLRTPPHDVTQPVGRERLAKGFSRPAGLSGCRDGYGQCGRACAAAFEVSPRIFELYAHYQAGARRVLTSALAV
jgi:hypothetical protein